MRRLLLPLLYLCLLPAASSAQEVMPLSDLLRSADTHGWHLRVTLPDTVLEGRVEATSESAARIDDRMIELPDVLRVEREVREGDGTTVWGFVVGGLAGGGLALLLATVPGNEVNGGVVVLAVAAVALIGGVLASPFQAVETRWEPVWEQP